MEVKNLCQLEVQNLVTFTKWSIEVWCQWGQRGASNRKGRHKWHSLKQQKGSFVHVLLTYQHHRLQWIGSADYFGSSWKFSSSFDGTLIMESDSSKVILWIWPPNESLWKFQFYFSEIKILSSLIQITYGQVGCSAKNTRIVRQTH